MDTWELDFEWLQLRHKIGQSMGRTELPDLQAILFLIGIQEQDLMHVAVCTLLEPDGYFEFVGRDQDGWPHWNRIRAFEYQGVETQERVLMGKILRYFEAVFEKEK
jgi:hypothetical protein